MNINNFNEFNESLERAKPKTYIIAYDVEKGENNHKPLRDYFKKLNDCRYLLRTTWELKTNSKKLLNGIKVKIDNYSSYYIIVNITDDYFAQKIKKK